MLKNNRDKVLIAVTFAFLVFMVLAAAMGGWPRAGAAADSQQIIQQAVFAYYERMPDDIYKIPEAEFKEAR
ncbi:hypothetical protein MTAT_01660 [Moorella thermoacetica]|uniref:Uncharacterized protein n=2 Tax=Neomoorella thermoacetica TaxID=1525 RepID=A0A1D7XDP0_NEOTH|nr:MULTISPECIES: hypothetical protein [Moorella]AOQ25025.1 hypothetical protein Maut_02605 [Moorella thermoacetica]OIQ07666.1 hypothetical protein MOOR_27210 [Moorella thermoacetica]OIQ10441.1 hypothetical protein MOOTH_26580 [Moorella thermoacetica]TYL15433.1 hypothetical protein MTAT_01660 [Moorella thermoacetica]BCV22522.1 hypothetical protein hamaS1_25910 [Moorella sp. Hama-1]